MTPAGQIKSCGPFGIAIGGTASFSAAAKMHDSKQACDRKSHRQVKEQSKNNDARGKAIAEARSAEDRPCAAALEARENSSGPRRHAKFDGKSEPCLPVGGRGPDASCPSAAFFVPLINPNIMSRHGMNSESFPRLAMSVMSSIRPEKQDWLWQGVVPLGRLSVWYGDGENAKSLTTLEFARG